MILSKKACGRDISITIHRIHIIWGYTDSPWAVDVHYSFVLLVMSCILMSRQGLM